MTKKPVKDFESNSFVISGEFLKKLVAGKIKLEEIVNPENIALFTWSGADIMKMVKKDSPFLAERKGLSADTLNMEALINNLADRLGDTDVIEDEVYSVFFAELDNLEQQNED